MLALVALSLAARLLFLGGKSLWADEAYAAALLDRPLLEGAALFSRGTPHPIGGFFLLWASAKLFGPTASGIRLLTALLTASAVIPVFGFIRRRLPGGAGWAALCWAVSPWSVSLGQEAWVYGPMAALAFWSLHLADGAWRGSRAALAFFIPVSVFGFLVQHVFILPAAAAVGLYFTLPAEERTGFLRPAVSALILLSAFIPVAAAFLGQFAARTRRLAAAGHGGLDLHRLAVRPPAVFLRLLPGGMLPEAWRDLVSAPVPLVTAAAAALLQTVAAADALLRKTLRRSFRIWLAAILLVPFLLFLKDDPTPRHFPLAWLVVAFGIASLASRRRWIGPAAAAFCLAMLVPYYGLGSWPYHRSDWRSAVRIVEERALESDAVILRGAKTALQAWEFYAVRDLECHSPHCTDPYRGEDEAPAREDPVPLLEGLLAGGRRVWLVEDTWGGPPLESLTGGRPALLDTTMGTLRILLLEDSRESSDPVSLRPGG